MAKLVMPLGSQEARGKFGGIIFNTYRGIATAKIAKSPTQPNTAAQINARARLTDATRAWASLTAAQRGQWNQFANDHLEPDWTGNPKRLTGHNMYVRLYTRCKLVGGTPVSAPPTAAAPSSPVITSFQFSAAGGGAIVCNFAAAPSATITWVVYGVGPLSAGRVPKFEQAAIKKQIISTDTTGVTVITTPGAGKWGLWYEAIDESTGLTSGMSFAEVTVS